MPRRTTRSRSVRASSANPKKVQPFSLILQPDELTTLRQIARKEGSSIGAVVRQAIHVVIAREHPEFGRQLLESEATGFFDELATRYPGKMLSPAKRREFKKQLVKSLK